MFCRTGRVPLEIADLPCFTLDRVSDNWCNEAAHLLDQATAAESDNVLSEFVQAGQLFCPQPRGNPIVIETNTLRAAEEASTTGRRRSFARSRPGGSWRPASDRGRDQDRGDGTTAYLAS